MPAIKYFCRKIYKIRIGINARHNIANNCVQFACHWVKNTWIAVVTVRFLALRKKVSAKRYSFQENSA